MNQYLVKALLSRQGKPGSLRFIPLEIFELWKTHMQNNHDYQVRPVQVSIWAAPKETEEHPQKTPPAGAAEIIVKVSIRKRVGGVEVPIERYFAEEELDRIMPKFLAHYDLEFADPMDAARIRLDRGVLLPAEDMFGDEL